MPSASRPQSETINALRLVVANANGAILNERYDTERATLTVDRSGFDAAAALRRAGFPLSRRAYDVRGATRYDVYVGA